MRIGHLVEHHDGAIGLAVQHLVEMNIVERFALEHQALVRRVMRDQPAKIGNVGVFDREIGR